MRAYRAAAVQMTSVPNLAKNLAQAEELIDLAVRQGAELISLPENFSFLGDEDAKIAAGEIVAKDLRVRPLRASQENTHDLVTARRVGEHLRTGRVQDGDAEDIVFSDDIVHDLGARTGVDTDALVGFRAAYNMVLRDSGVVAPASDDPASDIACDTVSHNSSVASGVKVDHCERVLVLEAPDREATNAHISHARPGDLAVRRQLRGAQR